MLMVRYLMLAAGCRGCQGRLSEGSTGGMDMGGVEAAPGFLSITVCDPENCLCDNREIWKGPKAASLLGLPGVACG